MSTHADEVLMGSLLDDTWLTLEQVAAACRVEPDWLILHIEEGLFPRVECLAGTWRFSSACLRRAQRMRQLEQYFDAGPELAALVADMLDEMDALRGALHKAAQA